MAPFDDSRWVEKLEELRLPADEEKAARKLLAKTDAAYRQGMLGGRDPAVNKDLILDALEEAKGAGPSGACAGGASAADLKARIQWSSKYAAHIPATGMFDPLKPGQGKEAATVVNETTIVTYAHDAHQRWKVGQIVMVMVHNPFGDKRTPIETKVHKIDAALDIIALKVTPPVKLIAPFLDTAVHPGEPYFTLGQSTQAQPDESSVCHGCIAATEPDALVHIRGDTESGIGDSGGGVFAMETGKLFAVCVGNDAHTKKAVLAPMAAILKVI